MSPRIAIVGAGAVGGYVGAHMVQAGRDVTFIDGWPTHVETMRASGLTVTHLKDVAPFNVAVRALHITDVQGLSKEKPIDIAFVCVKSYDTPWATAMIKPYLAPDGYVVSLQNCINEPAIASIVGEDRTLGSIASSITVELTGPGQVFRAAGKSGASHTVFRVGQPDGQISKRVDQVRELVALTDSALATTDLAGERWTKLVLNVMGNGVSACTGQKSRESIADDRIRQFMARLGSEAIRVGQKLGHHLEEMFHLDPEIIARAGEGDAEAKRIYDQNRLDSISKPGGGEHRPSMGQDMVKKRRTEIEFMNGLVVEKGRQVGVATPANALLTEIVKKVERGELRPDPSHLTRA
ncbi:MAG: 2-dehydropantoate 2-reductase [Xanthobacteraceae bacterium]